MKLGQGKTARAVPYSGAWIGMSSDVGFMCCFCGDSVPWRSDECRNCGAALTHSTEPVTEIEKRDIQIYHLKGSVADSWDFKGALLKYIVALERGEKPEWPKKYGSGAQLWLDRNGWSKGVTGEQIAAVTEDWTAFGRGGEGGA